MLYPKSPALDALDAWKHGGPPPESFWRYTHVTLPMHDVADDLTMLPRLQDIYPSVEFVLYVQPQNIERPEVRTYPPGSFRDRQQKIVHKAKAFVDGWDYINVDLRRCRPQLEDWVNGVPRHGCEVFLDCMNVGNVDAPGQRDYEWHVMEFQRNVDAQWSNTGGHWSHGGVSGSMFFERVPKLFYDGTWAGGLVNPVNGLVSDGWVDTILFVCNLSDDNAMPDDGAILQALSVCLLTDSILVAGTADGANRPDLAPLPSQCFADYGTLHLAPIERVATNCWYRGSGRAHVAMNLGSVTQMFVELERQLSPGEIVIQAAI